MGCVQVLKVVVCVQVLGVCGCVCVQGPGVVLGVFVSLGR